MAKKKTPAPAEDDPIAELKQEGAVFAMTPDRAFVAVMTRPLSLKPGRLATEAAFDRLDEACGFGGWEVSYSPMGQYVVCELLCRVPDDRGVNHPVRRQGVASSAFAATLEAARAWGIDRHGERRAEVKGGSLDAFAKSVTDSGLATVATPAEEKYLQSGGRLPPPPPPNSETAQEAVSRWAKRITGYATVDGLNADLPAIKAEPHALAVWNYVKPQVAQVGWLWDAADKEFYAQQAGDTIPF